MSKKRVNSINNIPIKIRMSIIFSLGIVLIAYHLTKISSLYFLNPPIDYSLLTHFQSLVRVVIIISLFLVILKKKCALFSMWVSILILVITQYITYFSNSPTDVSVFSYLKGFIFPSIITLLFPYKKDTTRSV